MPFLYETHLHTNTGSACGRSSGREHVRLYKDIGYTGVFITDHFFNGNTAIDRSLPWAKWVDQYCAGYEEARDEGEKLGLDVFFGWEENKQGDEYLIYGLDKQFLLAHPEMPFWTRRQQYDIVHAAGGCIVQAHPFRYRNYLSRILLGFDYVDGIEAANRCNASTSDAYAKLWAERLGLPCTAGSDRHSIKERFGADEGFGVAFEKKLTGTRDYAERILRRDPIGLAGIEEGRFDFPTAEKLPLEVYWLDGAEQPAAFDPEP